MSFRCQFGQGDWMHDTLLGRRAASVAPVRRTVCCCSGSGPCSWRRIAVADGSRRSNQWRPAVAVRRLYLAGRRCKRRIPAHLSHRDPSIRQAWSSDRDEWISTHSAGLAFVEAAVRACVRHQIGPHWLHGPPSPKITCQCCERPVGMSNFAAADNTQRLITRGTAA
jgi:hypothetical protein